MRRSKNAQNRMAVKQPEKFNRLVDRHRFVDVTKAVGVRGEIKRVWSKR